MTEATAAVGPLRRRMIDDMSLHNLSPATQRSYIRTVKRFAQFHGRSPDQLDLENVCAFQVYLMSQCISWPTINQTVCALRFFCGVTLDRAEIPERIAYARTPPSCRTSLTMMRSSGFWSPCH
jgi:integrase/recombinase XerD